MSLEDREVVARDGESMAQSKDRHLTASHPRIQASEKMTSDQPQTSTVQQEVKSRTIADALCEMLGKVAITTVEVGAHSLAWKDHVDSYTKLVNCITVSPTYKERSALTKD